MGSLSRVFEQVARHLRLQPGRWESEGVRVPVTPGGRRAAPLALPALRRVLSAAAMSAAAAVEREGSAHPELLVEVDLKHQGLEAEEIAEWTRSASSADICPGRWPLGLAIRRLDLGSNRLGDGGAGMLAGCLATDRTMRELSVAANNIGDAGAAALAAALRTNAGLTTLDLSSNRVGSKVAPLVPSLAALRVALDGYCTPGDTTAWLCGTCNCFDGWQGARALGAALAKGVNTMVQELRLADNLAVFACATRAEPHPIARPLLTLSNQPRCRCWRAKLAGARSSAAASLVTGALPARLAGPRLAGPAVLDTG